MASRLDDIPIYESRETHVDAKHFNLVFRALHRLNYQKKEIRFSLPELRTLDLLLTEDAWIVVDQSLNDIPVMAWLKFEANTRDDIHKPIPCTLNIYHAHAMAINEKVMVALDSELESQLSDDNHEKADVVPLIKD
jgi:hypothetical protein